MSSSPADAYLRNAVDSLFSLNHNGENIPVTLVAATSTPQPAAPDTLFGQAGPAEKSGYDSNILERLDDEDSLGGEKLGTERSSAVGLADQQKRQVHVRGVGTLRADGMKALKVACFQPVGSVFHFLSDDSSAVMLSPVFVYVCPWADAAISSSRSGYQGELSGLGYQEEPSGLGYQEERCVMGGPSAESMPTIPSR